VIIDRFPWKSSHPVFFRPHWHLILLAGSLITRYYGVDGSMSMEMGGKETKSPAETELKSSPL